MHHQLLKIFVCEFITGGGFCGQKLPQKLLKEGSLMRDALLRDLTHQKTINLTVFKCQIFTTVDARIAKDLPEINGLQVTLLNEQDDVWKTWEDQIAACDAVLVIAPETDGVLLKFAQLTQGLGKKWLGCSLDAIEICGDKLKTYKFLHQNKVPVPAFSLSDFLAYEKRYPNILFANGNQYIVKPRFGAGCEDTFVFENLDSLCQFMQNNRQNSHIIQTFMQGQHASITMLCKQGQAWLLSANQQIISTQKNGQLRYEGSVVNRFAAHWPVFERIAQNLAAWLPGLNGLVGVDIVFDEKLACIIEINPRLTTSYVGLAKSIGQNPAQLMLDCLLQDRFSLPKLSRKKVEVRV